MWKHHSHFERSETNATVLWDVPRIVKLTHDFVLIYIVTCTKFDHGCCNMRLPQCVNMAEHCTSKCVNMAEHCVELK